MGWYDDPRSPGNREPITAAELAEQGVRDKFDEAVQYLIVESGQDFTDETVANAQAALRAGLQGRQPRRQPVRNSAPAGPRMRRTVHVNGREYPCDEDGRPSAEAEAAMGAYRRELLSLSPKNGTPHRLWQSSPFFMGVHMTKLMSGFERGRGGRGRTNEEMRQAVALMNTLMHEAYPPGSRMREGLSTLRAGAVQQHAMRRGVTPCAPAPRRGLTESQRAAIRLGIRQALAGTLGI